MKILRPPSNKNMKNREIANKGCDICPYCKSDGDTISYLGEKKYPTMYIGHYKILSEGTTCQYECNKCGAKWESELF